MSTMPISKDELDLLLRARFPTVGEVMKALPAELVADGVDERWVVICGRSVRNILDRANIGWLLALLKQRCPPGSFHVMGVVDDNDGLPLHWLVVAHPGAVDAGLIAKRCQLQLLETPWLDQEWYFRVALDQCVEIWEQMPMEDRLQLATVCDEPVSSAMSEVPPVMVIAHIEKSIRHIEMTPKADADPAQIFRYKLPKLEFGPAEPLTLAPSGTENVRLKPSEG